MRTASFGARKVYSGLLAAYLLSCATCSRDSMLFRSDSGYGPSLQILSMSEEEGADSVGSFKIRLLSDGATIAEERYRSHFLTFAHAVWMPDRNAVVLGYCSFGMPEIRVWRSSDGVRQESQAYRAALLRSLIASYGTARGFEDWPSGPEGKREYCSQEAEKKYKEIGGHSPLGPGAVEEVGIVASSP